jgi:hypothetical protein
VVKALARAFRYQRCWTRALREHQRIAAAENIERGYLGSLLRLTLLAPDIVEYILDGRQPPGLSLPRLLEPFPLAWDDQRSVVADAAPWASSGA